jgi:MFS family permease
VTVGEPALPVPPVLAVALLCVAGLFCCNLMGVPTVHLVSLAIQQGLAPAAAAAVMTTAMIAACVGRVATGFVVDRIGALPAYALLSVVQTVGVACFPVAGDAAQLHLAGIVYGLGFGGVMTGLVCSVRDAVAPRHVGLAMAVVGLLAWVGMASGGYQGGLCFDLTGSYDLSFVSAALAGVANLATVCALIFLTVRGRVSRSRRDAGQEWAKAALTDLKGNWVMRTALRTDSTSGAA